VKYAWIVTQQHRIRYARCAVRSRYRPVVCTLGEIVRRVHARARTNAWRP